MVNDTDMNPNVSDNQLVITSCIKTLQGEQFFNDSFVKGQKFRLLFGMFVGLHTLSKQHHYLKNV